jgi:hypothetical protein
VDEDNYVELPTTGTGPAPPRPGHRRDQVVVPVNSGCWGRASSITVGAVTEPPVVELLPDSARVRAQIEDIYGTYRADGADTAMRKFMAHAGLGDAPAQEADAPRWEPSPQEIARMRATTDMFLAHLIRPTTRYRPDIEGLRAAPARIVVGAGVTSKGQLANRAAVALADQLGTTVVEFPGDHGGFMALPEQCGRVLDQVLMCGTGCGSR